MTRINQRIAERLVALRRQKLWSLDHLANKSGVSRASLSRLENGDVAATAEMLSKICTAYGLTLSRLIMMAEETFEPHIKANEQVTWQDPKTGFVRRSISPPADQLAAELLACSLPPATEIDYPNPPLDGLEHHLHLLEGGLTITVDDTRYELSPGDCLRYLPQGATSFQADSVLGAEYMLVLVS